MDRGETRKEKTPSAKQVSRIQLNIGLGTLTELSERSDQQKKEKRIDRRVYKREDRREQSPLNNLLVESQLRIGQGRHLPNRRRERNNNKKKNIRIKALGETTKKYNQK